MQAGIRMKISKNNVLDNQFGIQIEAHHTRNLYLRASLDTFTDVNLMPGSVYQLVFNDAKMQKLQVGTYTTDTVKIGGSCKF